MFVHRTEGSSLKCKMWDKWLLWKPLPRYLFIAHTNSVKTIEYCTFKDLFSAHTWLWKLLGYWKLSTLFSLVDFYGSALLTGWLHPPSPVMGHLAYYENQTRSVLLLKKKNSNINSSNYAFLFYLLRFNLTWKAFKKFRKVLVSVEMRRLSSDWSLIFLVKCTSARVTSACFCSLLKAFNTEEE